MRRALLLAAFLMMDAPAVAASTSVRAGSTATVVTRFGQAVGLSGLRVTPLAVVEDSRCPRLVTCVWRGRLRITAAVSGHGTLTLDNGVPVTVASGQLTLVDATPLSQRGERIPKESYRLKLRYQR